jgi:uncharacterized protein YaaN involved in tellurite resistance
MSNIDEQILRAAKEIIVKFIEAGRISPNAFHETFRDIYQTVEQTTKDAIKRSQAEARPKEAETEKPAKGKKK